jgi:membrane protein DedA with SNARE-associated domain
VTTSGPSPTSRRAWTNLRSPRNLRYVAAGLIVLMGIVVIAILEGDLPELFDYSIRGMRRFYTEHSYLPGYLALYIEESGIPLPAPGDVFVMFVGIHIPHHWAAWIAAWLGLVVAVVAGSTNLFFLSRTFGTRLVQSRYAEYVHLSPERLAKAEGWFKKYGVLAIIFGRHIPGFRVPITVAAGVLGVQYRVFAPSVAVSTAIWAGVMLALGVAYGPRLAVLLNAHAWVYVLWGAIVVVLVAGVYLRQRRLHTLEIRREEVRPVESPSS